MHVASLTGISEKELLAGIRGLQVPVSAVRVFAPIKGQALLHHLGGEVAPVGQEAPGNRSTVVIHVGDFRANCVALAEPVQRPFCVLAVRMFNSGASTPKRRIWVFLIVIVSPSVTQARPTRTRARARCRALSGQREQGETPPLASMTPSECGRRGAVACV
jgi:hypothetical protein